MPKAQTVRIIGGRWRGRKLSFPAVKGLRPTSDRIRETLFNWLQQELVGSVCLDLCAGSGALSLEALSRGASEAVLVEANTTVAATLRKQIEVLQAAATVIEQDAIRFLQTTRPFPVHVIFIDPPFEQTLSKRLLSALEDYHWLSDVGFIYVEMARSDLGQYPLMLPSSWKIHREMKTEQVVAYLLCKSI